MRNRRAGAIVRAAAPPPFRQQPQSPMAASPVYIKPAGTDEGCDFPDISFGQSQIFPDTSKCTQSVPMWALRLRGKRDQMCWT